MGDHAEKRADFRDRRNAGVVEQTRLRDLFRRWGRISGFKLVRCLVHCLGHGRGPSGADRRLLTPASVAVGIASPRIRKLAPCCIRWKESDPPSSAISEHFVCLHEQRILVKELNLNHGNYSF